MTVPFYESEAEMPLTPNIGIVVSQPNAIAPSICCAIQDSPHLGTRAGRRLVHRVR